MRYKLFFLLLLALIVQSKESSGQLCFPVKKIHGFFEPVSKGAVSREEVKKEKATGNYYVYVESKNSNITLNHIWINGIIYNGDLKEVIKPATPKQETKGTDKKIDTPDEMIPATKNKLFQVIFTALKTNQPAVPVKYSSKPLVMELQYKKKKKYFTLNDIKPMPAAAMY